MPIFFWYDADILDVFWFFFFFFFFEICFLQKSSYQKKDGWATHTHPSNCMTRAQAIRDLLTWRRTDSLYLREKWILSELVRNNLSHLCWHNDRLTMTDLANCSRICTHRNKRIHIRQICTMHTPYDSATPLVREPTLKSALLSTSKQGDDALGSVLKKNHPCWLGPWLS